MSASKKAAPTGNGSHKSMDKNTKKYLFHKTSPRKIFDDQAEDSLLAAQEPKKICTSPSPLIPQWRMRTPISLRDLWRRLIMSFISVERMEV